MYIDFSSFLSFIQWVVFDRVQQIFDRVQQISVYLVDSDFFSCSLIIHRYNMNIDLFFLSIKEYLVVITS
jgi:hypothetical protein